jgi:type I restriction enzyme, S subunit
MSSWRECKLGDILELKYGKDHKALKDGNIPVFGSGGIMRYADTSLYDDESILIPRKGTLNNIFYINEPFWTVDTIFWSKINTKEAFGKFLFYQLKTIDFANLNVGSAVPSLTTKVLNEVDISLPPLEEQKAIAEVLSSLDDKIDLLHRQNQTLESLAQTLFRQWFIEEAKEEWEEIKLGDFVDCITGYSYKSDHLNDSNNALVTLKNFARDGSFRLDGFK